MRRNDWRSSIYEGRLHSMAASASMAARGFGGEHRLGLRSVGRTREGRGAGEQVGGGGPLIHQGGVWRRTGRAVATGSTGASAAWRQCRAIATGEEEGHFVRSPLPEISTFCFNTIRVLAI